MNHRMNTSLKYLLSLASFQVFQDRGFLGNASAIFFVNLRRKRNVMLLKEQLFIAISYNRN